MKEFIEPYQYNFIKNQLDNVSRAYRSANDTSTLKALKSLTEEKINQLFSKTELNEHLALFTELHAITSTKEAEPFLEKLKAFVIPFVSPSDAKLKKVFAKTKKLKIPAWSKLDLRDYTFYGWNDISQQRKYIVTYEDGNLVGVNGTISADIQKGVCSICHSHSKVSLFMAKTKSSGDGIYTTNGNYICYNSDVCNEQIKKRETLDEFIEVVRKRK
ncbi:FusB/FusC family EF-G-binding protein [Listeria ivanovii]|uniref:Putative fibronectin-binding protein n=1 Tax=Listeria ivanovii (strain ATCC BAA-678 / PAM 55) TaxID=881621 RepID=G2ZCY7_LISIP|nr:elongation factor G-binding protein [Listeria ivanovii]AHI55243.1 ferrous iron transporter A [Listeria ivanovii WSLC3009]AIS64697.1 fibronectin-binding protein [Listeria ivanovii subsp. ivanovii]MBC1758607.1 elongation factor G-binding protein [Listeria ivanovii]MBK3913481.1 elongation factor G-binding protein [Listeria ivanovii subsp. ivanovii]MBK3920401.1 elongation factor G-binding protein [Listeria ivanovii subsp. ivanovii]